MVVYHGSDHIIQASAFHGGKRTNDYGYGFYTTENIELAKEWACSRKVDGYANKYELNLTDLRIMRLNTSAYNILNWLALLTKYRTYWQKSSIAERAKQYLQDNFFVDPEGYDIIIGYRADDSYFSFVQDFVVNAISLKKLSEAMRLGKLGEQVVLKSEKAYSHLHFLEAIPAAAKIYYEKQTIRDRNARRAYRAVSAATDDEATELYMLDIMREGIKDGDSRLR